jgi:branched-chain amino acid transport system ATP-binding protein
VALLGPNGAGKTTTLLALSGELPILEGAVLLDGVTTKAPLHKRAREGLAFVPEERSVFRRLSCRDNLRVGRAPPEVALTFFPELAERLEVKGGLLSGGEQQMLTLARALAGQPRLLLVDELSLGLAPLIVERLLAAVRHAADNGAGVILVEQHVRQALWIADYVHILRRGRIELSGPAAELRGQISEIERSYLSGA